MAWKFNQREAVFLQIANRLRGEILGGNAAQFAVSDELLAEFCRTVRKFIPAAEIRGR